MSPTARSLSHLRDLGWPAQVVEKFNPYSKTRLDLFGIIDIVALNGSILGIQATSTANIPARVKKVLASKEAREWVKSGGRLEVWGWAMRGPRGQRKTWTLRIVQFELEGIFSGPIRVKEEA